MRVSDRAIRLWGHSWLPRFSACRSNTPRQVSNTTTASAIGRLAMANRANSAAATFMAHLPRRIIDEHRAAVAQRPSMMLCHSGKPRRFRSRAPEILGNSGSKGAPKKPIPGLPDQQRAEAKEPPRQLRCSQRLVRRHQNPTRADRPSRASRGAPALPPTT